MDEFCGNCDAPVAIETRYDRWDNPIEEGYICLNCGYEHWEPVEEDENETDTF